MLCSLVLLYVLYFIYLFFFFNATATTEIYTLSLHHALPICGRCPVDLHNPVVEHSYRPLLSRCPDPEGAIGVLDRKSTRLNSSHTVISYAVFCLKKKNKQTPDCIY